MFYLTTHSTHFNTVIWRRTYGKELFRYESWNSLPPLQRLLVSISSKVFLYAPSHRQDCTYHGLCYTSRVALAETRNSSMGPPWWIDPTTYRAMSERSYRGAIFRSSRCNEWPGQVRSESLTCTFRASCCSARLSRPQAQWPSCIWNYMRLSAQLCMLNQPEYCTLCTI